MSLIYLLETTEHKNEKTPNHIYILNQYAQHVGYIKSGSDTEIMFCRPALVRDKCNRTFKDVTNEVSIRKRDPGSQGA